MALDLIGPDGREYVLPDDAKLGDAIKAGFRQAGPEGRTAGEAVRGTLDEAREQIVTGAEGVLRGATAGLSDPALEAAGYLGATPEQQAFNRSEMLRRKTENPVASIAGDALGMLASPLGKVQRGITGAIRAETALGRIGANIVGGAPVGALYGAGNAITDSVLGDSELTAEKLVAGAGLGAFLGGAGGGFGSALEEGVRVALPVAQRGLEALQPHLEKFSQERWFKASGGIYGGIKSTLKKIPEAERESVAGEIRQALAPNGELVPQSIEDGLAAAALKREGAVESVLKQAGLDDVVGSLKAGLTKDEALEAIEAGVQKVNARKLAVIDAAEAAGAKMELNPLHQRLNEFEAGLSPLKREAIAGDLASARKALAEYGGAAPTDTVSMRAGGKGAFRAMDEFRQDLQGKAKWEAATFGADAKRELAGIVRDEVDSQLARQVGPDLAKQFVEAKQGLGRLIEAEKALKPKDAQGAQAIRAIIEKAELSTPEAKAFSTVDYAHDLLRRGYERQVEHRWISPTDYLAGIGGALHGGVGGALLALPAALAHKIVREKGAGMVAALADRIAASPQLKLAAASFAQKVPQTVPHLGQYAPILTQAIAKSPALGLATHMVYAGANPDYAEKAQAAGFLPETPEEAGHAAGKASALVGVAAALKGTDDAIDRGVDKVLKGGGKASTPSTTTKQDFGTKRMRRDTLAGHEQRMKEVADLAANPEALLERITKNMGITGESAPAVTAAATAVAQRAVTYLAAQIQKPPKPGPLAPEWHFNDTELFIFSKKLEAVERPLSVLEHAAAGTLTKDQVNAIAAVYPSVAGQIRDRALERLTAAPKGVPYKARMMLGLLTGVDPDGTLGQAVAKNQQAISAESSKPSEQLGNSGTKGADPLKVAEQYATPQQRRELSSDEA